MNDRRGFLRRAGLAAGVGAVLPVLGAHRSGAAPTGDSAEPDRLFKAGKFGKADRGYERLLRKDPKNAHAMAQRGYIALMSNQFANAENFLGRAIRLAPGDKASKQRLADCFARQDDFARAVPLLREAGMEAKATQYASVKGRPYESHGAEATRLPFLATEPLPLVEAAVNDGEPRKFLLDTGATLILSMETAKAAGLRAVSSSTGVGGGREVKVYHGVMRSFRMAGIELHNLPVSWAESALPAELGDPQPSGVIGTTIFYHFLTTMDYASRALVLRRRTPAQLREFKTAAGRAAARPLPLWIAGDHIPCTLGSLNGYGPMVAYLDTGGPGGMGVVLTEEMARRAGIELDHDRPGTFNRVKVLPGFAREARLGNAVARDIYSIAGDLSFDAHFGFETIANFTHSFFKPFAITFDFTNMHFYVTGKTSPANPPS
ncbi:pepsin/retropepsin-like aspartic protease family protein [Actinomadura rubrisoli]|uniref:Tetratricopeptide repeat protein n=1 Tax=Actinomadura rubrisoli TaxID=2530368 RepID=A0A4V2YYS3_9ACTN|nr:pepsin/retropepsin-like aspartic protease family protein [Actinomadura rubrisoli]TDD94337.1 tetratricopeptide repeat protein [Actinomadura rubrisoli]